MPAFRSIAARLLVLSVLLPVVILLCQACEPQTEKDYFSVAQEFYVKGRYKDAIKVYEKYLTNFPKGPNRDMVHFRIAEIQYYSLRDRGAAIKRFAVLIQKFPKSDYTYQARELVAGIFKNEVRDYPNAVNEYRWLIEQRPDDPKAPRFAFQIAQCYLAAGNLEQAVLEFGNILEKYPDSNLKSRIYDELGSAYLAMGHSAEALFIYDSFLNKFPKSALANQVLFKKGVALEELYRFNDALALYEDLLKSYKNKKVIEIRIAGLKERKKNTLGDVKSVDYNYRPKKKRRDHQEFR